MRFDPDIGDADAVMPTYEGLFDLEITGVKGFAYTREKDGAEIGGVEYKFKMVGEVDPEDGSVDSANEGKSVSSNRLYVHSRGALAMGKRLLMAALGYAVNETGENRFNAEVYAENDWYVTGEGDDVEIGDGWELLVGRIVRCKLSIEEGNDGSPRQAFGAWMPVK